MLENVWWLKRGTESPFAHIRIVLVVGLPEDHMVSPVKET